MEKQNRKFNSGEINHLNERVIQSQLFTPDRVYIEMGLLKDIPIGVMYTDVAIIQEDPERFETLQALVIEKMSDYQTRQYETIEPFFASFGYDDTKLEEMLSKTQYHDAYFLVAPVSRFLNTLIRHTIRNQNNSRPANKYKKKSIGDRQYVLEAESVTYIFNTYPLRLSKKCMERSAEELGEAFGVNIEYVCKDPMTFDASDWNTWLGSIDCFYLDSLGRFLRSPIIIEKQQELETVGKYLFARKRFEKCVSHLFQREDELYSQIQMATALLDIYYEFNWLQHNEVRLTDEPEDSVDYSEPESQTQDA